jgi:GDP-L-fucose synthase
MIDKATTIFMTGHRGMVGSATVRRLQADGYTNVISWKRGDLDLLDQARTFD